MNIKQFSFYDNSQLDEFSTVFEPQLFLLFVSPKYHNREQFLEKLSNKYPKSKIIGCSTAGEILEENVRDASIAMTAIAFAKSKVEQYTVAIAATEHSKNAGMELAGKFDQVGLKHIFVLSDGLNVDGTELVAGLAQVLPSNVNITGGLAGDGSDFGQTFVVAGDKIQEKVISAIGFYGEDLVFGFGSKGGWDSFGLERKITKSIGNVLLELDGEPALDIYKEFLAERAKELPGSGLLFPLNLRIDTADPIVRTILAVNDEQRSVTFAGSMPEGSYVRMMKANIDRLIQGAEDSALLADIDTDSDKLAILISCVGRRLVLKQMVEEEVEAVIETLGENVKATGFYSYGEIAPFQQFSPCQLHNQTMTITVISEK
jgi:hypothetical protein